MAIKRLFQLTDPELIFSFVRFLFSVLQKIVLGLLCYNTRIFLIRKEEVGPALKVSKNYIRFGALTVFL